MTEASTPEHETWQVDVHRVGGVLCGGSLRSFLPLRWAQGLLEVAGRLRGVSVAVNVFWGKVAS